MFSLISFYAALPLMPPGRADYAASQRQLSPCARLICDYAASREPRCAVFRFRHYTIALSYYAITADAITPPPLYADILSGWPPSGRHFQSRATAADFTPSRRHSFRQLRDSRYAIATPDIFAELLQADIFAASPRRYCRLSFIATA